MDENTYENRITVDNMEFVKPTEEEKNMDYRERRKKYYEDMQKKAVLFRQYLEAHPEELEDEEEQDQEKVDNSETPRNRMI